MGSCKKKEVQQIEAVRDTSHASKDADRLKPARNPPFYRKEKRFKIERLCETKS